MGSLFASIDGTKAIALAGLALGIANAIYNGVYAWLNRRLAVEPQERRRAPRLLLSLVHGFYRRNPVDAAKEFAFLVTVRNPTDNNNSVAEADLAITYLTKDRVEVTVRVRASGPKTTNFVLGQEQVLSIAATISSHGATSGWLHFRLVASMADTMDTEACRLLISDAHGETVSLAVDLVQEYRDET